MCKGTGPISKKVRFTCERIRLSFVLFFIFVMFFSLFLAFLFLFFGALYCKNTVDECRHKILVVLVFIMIIDRIISQVILLQQVVITQHSMEYDKCVVIFLELVNMPLRVWSIWRYERAIGRMKNEIFGNFSKKMF